MVPKKVQTGSQHCNWELFRVGSGRVGSVGVGPIVIIRLAQFNCSCNCLLKLSLAKIQDSMCICMVLQTYMEKKNWHARCLIRMCHAIFFCSYWVHNLINPLLYQSLYYKVASGRHNAVWMNIQFIIANFPHYEILSVSSWKWKGGKLWLSNSKQKLSLKGIFSKANLALWVTVRVCVYVCQ